jgi:predicted DCC family thiol-disulfide oxidoreductase YuxK
MAFAECRRQIPPMEDPTVAPAEAASPVVARPTDLLFYDGTCGLCHRWVVFVLQHDRGDAFRFAAIGGTAWSEAIQPRLRGGLPDSLVLRTADRRTLVRSEAVLHIGERLGGGWRVVARLAGLLPRGLLDLGYDGIARVRKRLFRPPAGSCPMVPAAQRERFLP